MKVMLTKEQVGFLDSILNEFETEEMITLIQNLKPDDYNTIPDDAAAEIAEICECLEDFAVIDGKDAEIPASIATLMYQ